MSQTKALLRLTPGCVRDSKQETRPWGNWRILSEGPGYLVKLIEVSPAHRLSLQYHHHRAEHWLVVAGRARVVIANETHELGIMESAVIPQRTVHRIENPFAEPLQILEVQCGECLQEEDIVRLEDDYHRVQLAGGISV